ncbi:hypothetical protein [Escherichia coli]|jgi:hypothetical protein|uniref:hypothetical protein n=1 Tax=Escherichia coli TaxID=562 RepID=UPI00207C9CC2|nr:hypothetical protein [Escherichia coli]
MNFDPKTSIKNKILKTRSKNLTASLWITWGAENKKTNKNNVLQESRIASSEYSPSNPVEIQYSCGFSAYHLPKNRAYVLNLATDSLPLPRPLAR